MSNYIRPKIPGAIVFCTVVLARRGSTLLVEQIDILRDVLPKTKTQQPFQIEVWAVLPDHMHFV